MKLLYNLVVLVAASTIIVGLFFLFLPSECYLKTQMTDGYPIQRMVCE